MRARLVLPGRAPDTAFAANARERTGMAIPDAYAGMARQVFERFQQADAPVTRPGDVADAVWRAVTDADCPLRQPAGADAVAWAAAA